jgi:hypothetical protein
MKDAPRPSLRTAPPRRVCRAWNTICLGFALAIIGVALASRPAPAQVQQPSSIVGGKRLTPHANEPVARQLIPPAPSPLAAPPAPRPPLPLETGLLPLGSAPTAATPAKPAS